MNYGNFFFYQIVGLVKRDCGNGALSYENISYQTVVLHIIKLPMSLVTLKLPAKYIAVQRGYLAAEHFSELSDALT